MAILRYLVFSHQYYFLFLAFDVDLPYLILISAISSVYFLASSLPTFQFLDFAVKGSVAVYFFGILGVNEWVVVFVTTLMWFLNVVLPVIIGSYYVLNFKPPKELVPNTAMILFLLGIAIVYVLTISWLIYGFTKINHFEYIGLPPKTSFSIIVPFRNEAENLPVLLESFSKLNYPTDLFEVILVDDESEERFQIAELQISDYRLLK